MKVKLYTVLALLFVCAKSFATITTTIVSPTANSTNPNHILVQAQVVSTVNDIQTVEATISGITVDLTYNNGYFSAPFDLSTLPQGTLTLKVKTTDVFNNTDSASINLVHDGSLKPISTHVVAPTANSVNPNHMYFKASFVSTYPIQSVKVAILGTVTNAHFTGVLNYFDANIDLTSWDDSVFTLKVITADIAGNVDSSVTVTFKRNKLYKPVTLQITSPTPDAVDTLYYINIISKPLTHPGYIALNVKAILLGKENTATYSATFKFFVNFFVLTGLPQQRLTALVIVTDNLGNIDTTSISFYYHKAPKLQVVKDWPYAFPVVQQPFLHIRAACIADSPSCTIKVYETVHNKMITQGGATLDTLIDITGIAYDGLADSTFHSRNILKVVASDSFGLRDSARYDFIFEPSPYLKQVDTIVKAHNRVTVKENPILELRHGDEDDYYVTVGYNLAVITPDKAFTINYLWGGVNISYAYNDNYIVWEGYHNFGPPPYYYVARQNLHTYVIDTFFRQNYPYPPYYLSLDSNGNFIVGDTKQVFFNSVDSIQNLPATYKEHGVIDGDRMVYLGTDNKLHLYNNGSDTAIDAAIAGHDVYWNKANPAIAGNYIAYYKQGTLGQAAIWLLDSALNKKRITFSAADASISELDANGDMIYSLSGGYDSYKTFFADKQGNTKLISNFGHYNLVDGQRYINSSTTSSFLIKLDLNTNSLAPIRREVKKDSAYSFAKTDFDAAYIGPGHVFKVKITGLPKHGTLYINKVPVTLDSAINHASLRGLTYKPAPGFSGKDTIHWTAYTGSAFVVNDTIIQLDIVATLPVKLLTFTGTPLGKANQLRWQTAQEINSSYFGVEKSTDGIHFTTIGNVTAKGNSSITESYEYLDAAPQAGLNYYRLKIVDKDASFGYSQTISIRNTGSYITLAYPNPAKSFVNLSFTAARAGRYSFTVYSASGKAVSTNRYAVNTGSQNIILPLSGIASGTYVIKVLDGEGNLVTEQKVVKQ